MRRRSILKWIALTALSLTAVFTLFTTLNDDTVAAKISKKQSPDQGSLQALGQDGKPAGECPLKHTEVKAEVSGFISRVTVTQHFENNFPNKIEAVYTFPLPEAAAVDDLMMVIGERTIKGKVMRRQEAKATYTAAKQAGQIATLLDQQRPNVFTQQVANILPGERISVRLSYVETLKYEDGSYEWSFPMVVSERYTPVKEDSDTNTYPTTARIAPATVPDGMRLGHDISIELDLDAGLPIVSVNSETHETEVQQMDTKHAVVHLKDRATIPNRDFVLTYRVAGDSIDDAVLAHRSDRGGFFTLILQPPQRVAADDVMPKELVFVLDTSGSMSGFPIEKAKETMDLALNTLYPHDTFNLITFSGDTRILFPAPVPATPENLQTAKKFLASQQGNGGTEMMKAIKAALDPSDSQSHVRIACFMTDGQVGNDDEIIAEVQKHTNARVFAMGFGPAPNRYLLDRMSQYGRGEVNYVPESGDNSSVARRFNERVRNPLLTDIRIDWGSLAVHDVYPKRIPDLFGAKPLIVSGRYNKGGKGTIRLQGKMAGQDFVREIPVELPETESDHDVLSTVWARRRIDDLMNEESTAYTDPTAADQKREEITQLGLDYKLMTRYTSFVAVDDAIFTGADQPQRVEVPTQTQNMMTGQVMALNSSVVSCSFVVPSLLGSFVQQLPVNGRSFVGLVSLAPGVATGADGFFAIDGQRRSSNEFKLDGVSANFGIVAGGENPGPSASGNMPALTASGGGNAIAPLETHQEFNVKTSPVEAEYGRSAGGQIQIVTRGGANHFHGSLFHFFGNDAMDANDWFANSLNLPQPPRRLNSFGGTVGGPIKRDLTFFFASYDGLRLRQPMVGIADVPSVASRAAAPASLRLFLDAFPLPNGAARPDGFAEFASTFANAARHDAGTFRLDQTLNAENLLRGRYSFTDSDASQRGANGFSLNTRNEIRSVAQTATGWLISTLSPTVMMELRANYSRIKVGGSYLLDSFGGAAIPNDLSRLPSFAFDLNSRSAGFMLGDEATSVQRQVNLSGLVMTIVRDHTLKFGADYRRLSPTIGQRPFEENVLFNGMDQAITGIADRVNLINHTPAQNPTYSGLSLFAQDQWKASSRFTFTYGMRWELAPAPSNDDVQPLAVDQVSDPTRLEPAAPGSPLWKTTFLNFGPRVSAAYDPAGNGDWILRGGIGLLYDLGQDTSGDVFATSIPFVSAASVFNAPFPLQVTPATTSPFMVFDPHLKLPYVIKWNASLERSFDGRNSLTATYFGSTGKRLLHTETLLNQNPKFDFLRVVTNRGSSEYRALELTFNRRFSDGLTALVSYTWAQSLDDVAYDSPRRVVMTSVDPNADRGPSDFDIRHQLTGYISYELPAPVSRGVGNKLLRNWALDSIFNARSARPLNVVYMIPTSFGVAYLRPDLVSGTLYIFDPAIAGGRRLNRAAFLIPEDLQQGNLPRNSLRGFQFYQVDLALRRKFHFTDDLGLQIQADAFNLFNRANFEDPLGNDLVVGPSMAFGQSTSMSGARTVRVSVKFLF